MRVSRIELGKQVNGLKKLLIKCVFDGFKALQRKSGWQEGVAAALKRAATAIDAGKPKIQKVPELAQFAARTAPKLRAEADKLLKRQSSKLQLRKFIWNLFEEYNDVLSNVFKNKNKRKGKKNQ